MSDSAVMEAVQQRESDEFFGQIAVERGFCTRDQVSEALQVQALNQKHGRYFRLGVILVKKGYLGADDAKRLLHEQRTTILEDRQTGQRFNVLQYDASLIYTNPHTGNRLVLSDMQSGGVDGILHGRRDGKTAEEFRELGAGGPAIHDTTIPAVDEGELEELEALEASDDDQPQQDDDDDLVEIFDDEDEGHALPPPLVTDVLIGDGGVSPDEDTTDEALFEASAEEEDAPLAREDAAAAEPVVLDEPIIDAHQRVDFLDAEEEAEAAVELDDEEPEAAVELDEEELEAAELDDDDAVSAELDDDESDAAVELDDDESDAAAELDDDDFSPPLDGERSGDDPESVDSAWEAPLSLEDDEAPVPARFKGDPYEGAGDHEEDDAFDDDEADDLTASSLDEGVAVGPDDGALDAEGDDQGESGAIPLAPTNEEAEESSETFEEVLLTRTNPTRFARYGDYEAPALAADAAEDESQEASHSQESDAAAELPADDAPQVSEAALPPQRHWEVASDTFDESSSEDADLGMPTATVSEGALSRRRDTTRAKTAYLLAPAPGSLELGTVVGGCELRAPRPPVGRCLAFLAHHRLLERDVVVHLTPAGQLDEAQRDKLPTRCKALLCGDSTGLQRLIDFGEDQGYFYLVRDCPLGKPLADLTPMSEARARDLLQRLRLALASLRHAKLLYQPLRADTLYCAETGVELAGIDYTAFGPIEDEGAIVRDLAVTTFTALTGDQEIPSSEEELVAHLAGLEISAGVLDVVSRVLFPGPEGRPSTIDAFFDALEEDLDLHIEEIRPPTSAVTRSGKLLPNVPAAVADAVQDAPDDQEDTHDGALGDATQVAGAEFLNEPGAFSALPPPLPFDDMPAAGPAAPFEPSSVPPPPFPDLRHAAEEQSNHLAGILFLVLMAVLFGVLFWAISRDPDDEPTPAQPSQKPQPPPNDQRTPGALEVAAQNGADASESFESLWDRYESARNARDVLGQAHLLYRLRERYADHPQVHEALDGFLLTNETAAQAAASSRLVLKLGAPRVPVRIDGDDRGVTNNAGALRVENLAPGRHVVEIGGGGRYRADRFEVTLSANDEAFVPHAVEGDERFWRFPLTPGMTQKECDHLMQWLAPTSRPGLASTSYYSPEDGSLLCELQFTLAGALERIVLARHWPIALGGSMEILDGLDSSDDVAAARAVLGEPLSGRGASGRVVEYWPVLMGDGSLLRLGWSQREAVWIVESESLKAVR